MKKNKIIPLGVAFFFCAARLVSANPDSVVTGGDLHITGNGNGLVFPDGSVQTTAFSFPFGTTANTVGNTLDITNLGAGETISGTNMGTGSAANFTVNNAANGSTAVAVFSNGTGTALSIVNSNVATTANVLNVTAVGSGVIFDHSQGNAGNFFMNNTNGVGAGVRGEVNSIFGNNGTAGVYGVASGTGGYAGYFEHSNASGYGVVLKAVTSGLGVVGHFETIPAANNYTTLETVTYGLGSALTATNNNTGNTANTLSVVSRGPGVISDHSQGNAGNFFMNNTSGVGAGVRGEVNSIFGNSGTAGVYGVASGAGGYAGYFEHSDTTGSGITLYTVSHGLGAVFVVDHEGTSGDLGVFKAGGANKARIDRTGKGYFNGGTQNSGADLAELFDVEGALSLYSPGDVLEISTTADRTVTRSTAPYSTLVAGVYATKPGVVLTEDAMDADYSSKIPLGVVGVIPTRVCDENGPIHRGDHLVTSSKPGYAMKGDPDRIRTGQALGKALEEFAGVKEGMIRVLVNVH